MTEQLVVFVQYMTHRTPMTPLPVVYSSSLSCHPSFALFAVRLRPRTADRPLDRILSIDGAVHRCVNRLQGTYLVLLGSFKQNLGLSIHNPTNNYDTTAGSIRHVKLADITLRSLSRPLE